MWIVYPYENTWFLQALCLAGWLLSIERVCSPSHHLHQQAVIYNQTFIYVKSTWRYRLLSVWHLFNHYNLSGIILKYDKKGRMAQLCQETWNSTMKSVSPSCWLELSWIQNMEWEILIILALIVFIPCWIGNISISIKEACNISGRI